MYALVLPGCLTKTDYSLFFDIQIILIHQIKADDILLCKNKSCIATSCTQIESWGWMIDIQLEDPDHTFYVGHNKILAHNNPLIFALDNMYVLLHAGVLSQFTPHTAPASSNKTNRRNT